MPLGLIALAMGGFGIGLTEFVIMGLLPEVSADFEVTESVAGYLISGYALSVAIGAILLTAAVTRFERKKVLLSLMVLFIIGNLMSALAPSYEVMMGGRIVAALCHGAFFGIGSVVAADMVAPNKRAGAIAMMFAGLTIANVLGVPFGTLLGQQLGWRSTFWAITVIGVIALIGIAALVPTTPASTTGGGLRGELGAFRNKQVWLSIAITILGYGGMFGAFTYIAFTLTEVTGFATSSVPWLLILFGSGLFVGNFLGAKAADRSLTKSLVWILAILTVVLIVFAATAESKVMTVISLFFMGAFGFATVPGLQMRIMNYASATRSVHGWAESPSPRDSASPPRSGWGRRSPSPVCWS
jgi:DHA1 family inner membrane transport protein